MAKVIEAPASYRRRRTLGLLVDWLSDHYQDALLLEAADLARECDKPRAPNAVLLSSVQLRVGQSEHAIGWGAPR
jgi:hypothetical protein